MDFARALVGHFKAGLAQVTIASSPVFASISGSAFGVSIGALFAAGLTIAVSMTLLFGITTYLMVLRYGVPAYPWLGTRELACAAARAALPLGVPLIVVGGIPGRPHVHRRDQPLRLAVHPDQGLADRDDRGHSRLERGAAQSIRPRRAVMATDPAKRTVAQFDRVAAVTGACATTDDKETS